MNRNDPEPTDLTVTQTHALVRAIEALATIQPTNPLERHLARLLLHVYNRRLRTIAEAAPARPSEETLSANP